MRRISFEIVDGPASGFGGADASLAGSAFMSLLRYSLRRNHLLTLMPFGKSGAESQRDSGPKPKVARDELPWVSGCRNIPNPNGVGAPSRSTLPQPRWGWLDSLGLTQGSSCLATLGWRTQSLWDCRTDPS